MTKAYEEMIDFIAAGTSPESLIKFQPSEETRARVLDLLHTQKSGELSRDEQNELGNCLQLEHILRLAKARARKYLAS